MSSVGVHDVGVANRIFREPLEIIERTLSRVQNIKNKVCIFQGNPIIIVPV